MQLTRCDRGYQYFDRGMQDNGPSLTWAGRRWQGLLTAYAGGPLHIHRCWAEPSILKLPMETTLMGFARHGKFRLLLKTVLTQCLPRKQTKPMDSTEQYCPGFAPLPKNITSMPFGMVDVSNCRQPTTLNCV